MNVLIVAAHPDDEVLGCGGTIARHAAKGDVVEVVIVGEGATSRPGNTFSEKLDILRTAAKNAALAIGSLPPRFFSMPDNRLDTIPLLEIVQKLEEVVNEVRPDTVYTHHGGDLNVDHQIVHRAVITSCRPIPQSCIKRIYTFETLSSTEWSTPSIGGAFVPNRYVDISYQLNAKLSALRCYNMEMRSFPHARSLEAAEAQAHLRGSQVGMMAAEAFQTELDLS
jgi:LmbE family N-acetylglucosaminyl deacetylase